MELVKRRVPGYEDVEYLSEVNAAYNEVWQEVMQIDELYFSDVQTLTVTAEGDTFDFVNNIYANLGFAIPRMHQIHRVRVQLPGTNQMHAAVPTHLNSPDFVGIQRNTDRSPYSGPPFFYVPFGIGGVQFARKLPVNSKIEVFFTFGMVDLVLLDKGQVTSSGTAVTGADTFFTKVVSPELAAALPSQTQPSESQIEAEIIVAGVAYHVSEITNDTLLKTASAITPGLGQAQDYILALVPELPHYAHRTIADIATRNILSTPGDDPRFGEWAAIAGASLLRLKNTLQERQRQKAPRKQRFPYSASYTLSRYRPV